MQHLATREIIKSVANTENVTQHLPREESTVRNVIHASVTRYGRLNSVLSGVISANSGNKFSVCHRLYMYSLTRESAHQSTLTRPLSWTKRENNFCKSIRDKSTIDATAPAVVIFKEAEATPTPPPLLLLLLLLQQCTIYL